MAIQTAAAFKFKTNETKRNCEATAGKALKTFSV